MAARAALTVTLDFNIWLHKRFRSACQGKNFLSPVKSAGSGGTFAPAPGPGPIFPEILEECFPKPGSCQENFTMIYYLPNRFLIRKTFFIGP
jgi:hypothetical protein